MRYAATLQFRTTLDQAGRIAGLAGELEVPEAEVLRLLLDRALSGRGLLPALHREVRRERERERQAIRDAERTGTIPGGPTAELNVERLD